MGSRNKTHPGSPSESEWLLPGPSTKGDRGASPQTPQKDCAARHENNPPGAPGVDVQGDHTDHSSDENCAARHENNPPGAPGVDVQGDHTDNSSDESKERKWLRFALRLLLFSPLKWKEDACWISILHFLWFIVHVIKIGFFTELIFSFGYCRAIVKTIENNRYVALQHILLEHWETGYETLPYPPAHGVFAVYEVDDLRSGINYTVAQFYNAENMATGKFIRTENDNISVNILFYNITEDATNVNNSKIVKNYSQIIPNVGLSNYTNTEGQTVYRYNVSKDIIAKGLQGVLKNVSEVNLTFALHAVRIGEDRDKATMAVCHQIRGNVTYNDYNQDGQLELELNTIYHQKICRELGFPVNDFYRCDDDAKNISNVVKVFAIATVVVDSSSFILGIVVLIYTSIHIWKNYKNIYQPLDNESNLPFNEYLRNVKWWLIISVWGDIKTLQGIYGIIGKKQGEEFGTLDSHVVNLGYGYLLTLLSFLRFLRISHKFSVLFKTVWRSAVDVLYFLVCVIILFVGFWLSSFIVLSPYHIKFQTISSTSETLFSIIKGGDIYATFAILQANYSGDSEDIWWFSRFIIYLYVSLFTVLVFNLLIALFNNAYIAVKVSYDTAQETKPLVNALREYLNYKRHKDNDFSRDLRELMVTRCDQDDESEIEMRKNLRKVLGNNLFSRNSSGGMAVIERRKRSLFYFTCGDFERDTQHIEKKDCCWCMQWQRTCKFHHLLVWIFAKCWFKEDSR